MLKLILTLFLSVGIVWLPIHASCQQQEGVIVTIEDGSVVVRCIDYYGVAKKEAKFVEKTLKIVPDAVYVMDGRIVPREMALKAGRRIYAQGSSKGCFLVTVLSEANTEVVGTVKAVEGDKLTLTIDHGTDQEELIMDLAADAVGRELAKVGAAVKVAAARPLTVDVLTAEARAKAVDEKVPRACCGMAKEVEGGAVTLATVKEGAWAEEKLEDSKPPQVTVNCRFQDKSPQGFERGARLACVGYWKRPGKLDRFAAINAFDPGRREGIVTAAGADTLGLAAPDGTAGEVAIAGATVLIDGKPGEAAAIPVGSHAFVFAARKQTIAAVEVPTR